MDSVQESQGLNETEVQSSDHTPQSITGAVRGIADNAADLAGDFRNHVIHFVKRAADAARRTIAHVDIVLAMLGLSSAISFCYLFFMRDWYLVTAVFPTLILVVPAVILIVCHRILKRIIDVPDRLNDMTDELAVAAGDYREQIMEIESSRLGLLTRWKSYMITGKMLWKLRTLYGDAGEVYTTLGATAMMANPLFWAVLFGAVLASFLLSLGVLAFCAVHFLWAAFI